MVFSLSHSHLVLLPLSGTSQLELSVGEIIFAILEIVIELIAMSATGCTIIIILLVLAAIGAFGYWAYIC